MERILWEVFLLWILFGSIVEFVACGYDKACAKLGRWRVPERFLLGLGILGGGLGLGSGMLVFRHKTKHTAFKVVGTISCVFYIAAIAYAAARISLL